MNTPNEQMALLLGWHVTPTASYWWHESARVGDPWTPPDFTGWLRFPEMQSHVRGLDMDQQAQISALLDDGMLELTPDLEVGQEFMWLNPTILRDAVLEVCEPARPQDRE